MSKKILTTPIKDEDLESLTIGDIVYLNGYLITGRDDVHQRLIKQSAKLTVDVCLRRIRIKGIRRRIKQCHIAARRTALTGGGKRRAGGRTVRYSRAAARKQQR